MTKFEMDALIDAAVYHLDHLDPILGFDLRTITECFPYSLSGVARLFGACRRRGRIHDKSSALWSAWSAALECVTLVRRHGCKYNNHTPILEG